MDSIIIIWLTNISFVRYSFSKENKPVPLIYFNHLTETKTNPLNGNTNRNFEKYIYNLKNYQKF